MVDDFNDLQYDPNKERINIAKHDDIDFTEADSSLDDPYSITARDYGEYNGEQRYMTIGMSYKNRLLVVFWTERQDDVRIISARLAEPNQRKIYEKRR